MLGSRQIGMVAMTDDKPKREPITDEEIEREQDKAERQLWKRKAIDDNTIMDAGNDS